MPCSSDHEFLVWLLPGRVEAIGQAGGGQGHFGGGQGVGSGDADPDGVAVLLRHLHRGDVGDRVLRHKGLSCWERQHGIRNLGNEAIALGAELSRINLQGLIFGAF